MRPDRNAYHPVPQVSDGRRAGEDDGPRRNACPQASINRGLLGFLAFAGASLASAAGAPGVIVVGGAGLGLGLCVLGVRAALQGEPGVEPAVASESCLELVLRLGVARDHLFPLLAPPERVNVALVNRAGAAQTPLQSVHHLQLLPRQWADLMAAPPASVPIMLESLDFGSVIATDDHMAFVGRTFLLLKQLHVPRGAVITNEGIRHLGGLKDLEEICLNAWKWLVPSRQESRIDDAVLPLLQNFENLKRLELRSTQIRSLRGMGHRPALEELDLMRAPIESTDGLQGCPQLRSLCLNAENVPAADFERIAQLRNLQRLTLDGAVRLGVETAVCLMILPLRFLHLASSHVDGTIFENAPDSLRELLLYRVTGVQVKHLPRGLHAAELGGLNVSGQLDDLPPFLVKLVIMEDRLTDDDIRALCRLEHLQELRLVDINEEQQALLRGAIPGLRLEVENYSA